MGVGMIRYAAPASTQIGRLAINFDDGFASVYSVAYPYLAARGIQATVYATKDYIGTANYMTEANLQALDGAGWDIGNHSETHPDFTTLTQAQIETELTNCSDWLDGLGLTRASHHVAYPFGNYDADVEAAMLATGMVSGRLADGRGEFNYAAGITSVRQIHCDNIASGAALSDAVHVLLPPMLKNYASVLLWHHLTSGTLDFGYYWHTSDFQALMDVIVARAIPCVTITELYPLLA